MPNIQLSGLPHLSMSQQPVELVEQKDIGHPDSMCDAIMEAISVALCRAYIDVAGRPSPLHTCRPGGGGLCPAVQSDRRPRRGTLGSGRASPAGKGCRGRRRRGGHQGHRAGGVVRSANLY